MIESVSCSHIPAITDQPQSSINSTRMGLSVTSIENFPEEILRPIALQLSSNLYEILRETHPSISHKLPSYTEMQDKLGENRCHGSVKNNYQCMLMDKTIRSALKYEQEAFFALNKTFSGAFQTKKTKAGAQYQSTLIRNQPASQVRDILSSFRAEIITNCVSELNDCNRNFYCTSVPSGYAIIFNHSEITLTVLDIICASAKKVFDKTKGPKKLLLTAIVLDLQKYWQTCPPNYLKVDDVREVFSRYDDFFRVGEKAKKIALEIIKEKGSKGFNQG